MDGRVIYRPKGNHIPDEIFALARTANVFIEDELTGDLVQVLDICAEEAAGELACEPDSLR